MGAVSKYLVRTRKRTSMALILESGEPRLVHDFATLLGYGAAAINPYLAQETIGELISDGHVWAKKAIKEAKLYGEVELLASSEDRNFTYIQMCIRDRK